MLTFEELSRRSAACGFTHCARLKAASIRLLPQVREMCEKNTCGEYGKTWFCPPAPGDLEECEKRIRRCSHGLLVQTVGELEDPFDYDSMVLAMKRHNESFALLREDLRGDYYGPNTLAYTGCLLLD